MKVYNFGAGPSILPQEVMKATAEACISFGNTGLSLMEMSHRTPEFQAVMDEAQALVKELLNVPEGYSVLFLGGGASLEFCMAPMNFLKTKAAYLNTGVWAKKALAEAKRYGQAYEVATSGDRNHSYIPERFQVEPGTAYVHITANNTIYGTEYQDFPDFGVPLICDMSSDILSRPVDVSKFDLIYAGAQKNLGPAGVVIVIVKKSFLDVANGDLPTMLKYSTYAENDSLYNTAPVFAIYMVNKTLHWLKKQGGAAAMQERNRAKAQIIYDAIDNSKGFYIGHAEKKYRSMMNITFNLANKDLEKEFVEEGKRRGFVGIGGHRLVGGCRASTYNAVTMEACQALAKYMKEFQDGHI